MFFISAVLAAIVEWFLIRPQIALPIWWTTIASFLMFVLVVGYMARAVFAAINGSGLLKSRAKKLLAIAALIVVQFLLAASIKSVIS